MSNKCCCIFSYLEYIRECSDIIKPAILQITNNQRASLFFFISGRRASNRAMAIRANGMFISVIIYPNESIKCSIISAYKMAIIS